MLYLVATPIGNLEDFSYRAKRILNLCDYILCEDTRKSVILLNFYKIKKRLVSFHKFSEKKQLKKTLEDLQNGKNVALISDSGSPLICDPGEFLIEECKKLDIKFTSIPGACSVINGLILSGGKIPFQFLGFAPKKVSEIESFVMKILGYEGRSIFFETSHNFLKFLNILVNFDKNIKIHVMREMTKKFEEVIFETSFNLLNYYLKNPLKGELVIIIEGKHCEPELEKALEIIKLLTKNENISLKEAMKIASKITNIKKQIIYNIFSEKNNAININGPGNRSETVN